MMRVQGMARRAATLVCLMTVALSAACDRGPKGPPIGSTTRSIADSADQVVFGQRTMITDRGVLRAEILADTSFVFDENSRVDMRVVHGTFFSSVGVKDALLTSARAKYNVRDEGFEANGNVVVTSLDGRRLTTEHLVFDQRANKLSSEVAFVMTEPGGREMRGIGFDSDPDMNNVRVHKSSSGKAGAVIVPNR